MSAPVAPVPETLLDFEVGVERLPRVAGPGPFALELIERGGRYLIQAYRIPGTREWPVLDTDDLERARFRWYGICGRFPRTDPEEEGRRWG